MNTILFILLIVVLLAIIYEDELIAFEDWVADRIGFVIAKIILWYRRKEF